VSWLAVAWVGLVVAAGLQRYAVAYGYQGLSRAAARAQAVSAALVAGLVGGVLWLLQVLR
jgi:hypothetical protein